MNTAGQIKQVEGLRGVALREKFREVTGLETRSNNRPYLIKRIVHALQARMEGGPETVAVPAAPDPGEAGGSSRAKKVARANKGPVPRTRETRERDPRLPPPGTVLEREHDGKTIRVKVMENGFEYRNKTYRSLSAIAREVTGTCWNGLLWMRLIPYAKRDKAA